MSTPRKPLKLWFIMRRNLIDGSFARVGPPYRSRELARSWIDFVRAAWLGHEMRIVTYTIRFDKNGSPTKKSKEELDRVYNMAFGDCTKTIV